MNSKIVVLTAGVAALSILAAGCSKKHEDFPDPLGVSVPQNVINLTVTNPQNFDYDLSWGVNDPGTVQYYRVYWSIIDGVAFILAEDTVATTSVAYDTSPFAAFAFGVSVVSNENVEGAMVVEETP